MEKGDLLIKLLSSEFSLINNRSFYCWINYPTDSYLSKCYEGVRIVPYTLQEVRSGVLGKFFLNPKRCIVRLDKVSDWRKDLMGRRVCYLEYFSVEDFLNSVEKLDKNFIWRREL